MSVMFFKAINFATRKHGKQIRKGSKLPYVTHPLRAADLIGGYKESKNYEALLTAAMLHDTLEDTETDYEEIEREFGPMVASIVKELTSDEDEVKQWGKNEYLKKKSVGLSDYGLFLKLIDRLDNIMDGPSQKYVKDTIELILHIESVRKLTASQKRVADDILKHCYRLQPLEETLHRYI